ncbi:NlpC/P60 family protein [Streptomyces sp. NBC_01275]|uniref:C40 family peptidase n=1 Tax=Streptomyces sp. NBC_01275 TaxID=2903807 RepID=UPI00224DD4E9|nr:C40 family peptidase [Streptomyces sp. NBC_01275]MCX4763818.1 NlpC/P60 family protein [Streptomyces sp. NBC_01275]
MDKKTLIAILAVCAFLFSGCGLVAVVGGGAVAGVGSILSGVVGGDDGGDGSGAPSGTVCDPGGEELQTNVPGVGSYRVTEEQMGNAAIIVHVGEATKVPDDGLVIAIMTALQESQLRNIDYGDRDSIGLFQQRPAAGWGSHDEIMDPNYSAKAFFGGPNHPSPPNPRGLLGVPNWQQMDKGAAAQAVQVSAFPDAYSKWEGVAGQIVGRAKNIECSDVGLSGDVGKVIQAAKNQLGIDYCWAGGDAKGPTYTSYCPQGVSTGFDCSGLTLYAYAQVGITLGHYTGDQWNVGSRVESYSALQPGDLMFWSSDGSVGGIHHVSMYLGNDEMIHAPRTGKTVEIVKHVSANTYWMNQWIGGSRILKSSGDSGSADTGSTGATGNDGTD